MGTFFSAVVRMIRRPDDLTAAYSITKALGARSSRRSVARFRKSQIGARILAERRNLPRQLANHRELTRLPEGCLGYKYADFMLRENLSIEGLMRPGGPPAPGLSADEILIRARLSVLHDLGHVVTGYGRDDVGEICLMAFTFAQDRNPGLALILLIAALHLIGKNRAVATFKAAAQAFQRGRAAPWLGSQDWEQMLTRPLEQVRTTLNLTPPTSYQICLSPEIIR